MWWRATCSRVHPGRAADSRLPIGRQLGEALFGVLEERSAVPFFLDGHEFPVGIGSPRTAQPFLRATQIVIDGCDVGVRGHVIREEFHGFPASLEAALKLGI